MNLTCPADAVGCRDVAQPFTDPLSVTLLAAVALVIVVMLVIAIRRRRG